MREYKINQYITLKLIDGKTVIFVNGEEFKQCKYLLLNIPIDEMQFLSEIESIDEAVGKLDFSLESQNYRDKTSKIPPEAEFWAHCSNLQVWAENDYRSNILHRNIAFPLLKKLVDARDLKARKVFKEEIAIRVLSQHFRTVQFLVDGRYLKHLSNAEIKSVILEALELNLLETLFLLFKRGYFKLFTDEEINSIFENFYQKLMETKNNEIRQVACELFEHIALSLIEKQFTPEELYFEYEKESTYDGHIVALEIRKKPSYEMDIKDICGLKYLTKLKRLILRNFEVNSIKQLENMVELNALELSNCQISEIEDMDSFQYLKKLIMPQNRISEITGIFTLANLEILNLRYNNISKIVQLNTLNNLRELDLRENNITEIAGLDNLRNLIKLNLSKNKIEKIKGLENLINLEELDLSVNQIQKIQGFDNLRNLRGLNLSYNMIEEVENLEHLEKLRGINLHHTKVVYTKKLEKLMKGKFVGLDDHHV